MGIHTPSGKAAAARHKDQAVSYLVGVFVDVVRVAVGNLNEDRGLIEHVEGDGGRQAEFQGEFKVGLHNLVLLHSANKEPLDWKKEKGKEKEEGKEERASEDRDFGGRRQGVANSLFQPLLVLGLADEHSGHIRGKRTNAGLANDWN